MLLTCSLVTTTAFCSRPSLSSAYISTLRAAILQHVTLLKSIARPLIWSVWLAATERHHASHCADVPTAPNRNSLKLSVTPSCGLQQPLQPHPRDTSELVAMSARCTPPSPIHFTHLICSRSCSLCSDLTSHTTHTLIFSGHGAARNAFPQGVHVPGCVGAPRVVLSCRAAPQCLSRWCYDTHLQSCWL